MRRACRWWIAAGSVAAGTVLVPWTAGAVTSNVIGDDGAPVPVTAGLVIRNMDAKVIFSLAPHEGLITAAVIGPDGVTPAASPLTCTSYTGPRGVDYRGNGVYTVVVQSFLPNDHNCTAVAGAQIVRYSVSASVALSPPAGRIRIRRPGSFSTRVVNVPIALNPGALAYEVRYARGGAIGPDGAIAGASSEGFVDRAKSVVPLRLTRPGRWVIVARAKGYSTSGQFFTPWSAPAVIRAVAPFDLDRVSFPDSRGPSYQLRGQIKERSARGSVSISIAPGRKGKFRSLGRAKIRRNGVFVKRFTVRQPGAYRVRYRFAGSATTAKGQVVKRIRISRQVFFG